jgi:hypothetical protein
MRWWLAVLGLAMAIPAAAQDVDRDGISDQLEQQLLDRFAPTLLLARGECDSAPASFEPFRSEPLVRAKDGTLYGQAFPSQSSEGRARIELHFFHLWSRDCGRIGHDLDAEHVSAIVSAARRDAPSSLWIADVWYAAAHQGSACDASSGARSRAIGAEANGPRVFVSKGKHASYFDRGQCKWGCGGDECGDDRVIVPGAVVNIGESGAPMNGALWLNSRRWTLHEKLSSDFSPEVRARLDAGNRDRVVALMLHLRGAQAPVLAGDTALDGLGTAATHTKGALGTATRAVARFLKRK